MTVSVSVAIMAHPKRESFIPELIAALDRPATVVLDEKNDRWDTGRRSMLAFDPAASHHLVVQDDAVLCRDLVAGVERALAYAPDDVPVCLYVGTVRPWPTAVAKLVQATREDTSWLRMGQLNWGVAVVMPTRHIEAMVRWCDGRPEIANYDKRMSRWFEHQGIKIWYTWPSLVDHRDSPSLVAGRKGGRFAHRFVGRDASALEVRFDGGVLEMPPLNRGGEQPWHSPRPTRRASRRWIHRESGRIRRTTVGSAPDQRYESLPGWEVLPPLADMDALRSAPGVAIAAAEEPSAQAVLDAASTKIRAEAGQVWDSDVPALAAAICVDVAARVWTNPKRLVQQATGPFSGSVAQWAAAGLVLTEEEKQHLADLRRAVKVGTG